MLGKAVRPAARVMAAAGLAVRVAGVPGALGDACRIWRADGTAVPAEVAAFPEPGLAACLPLAPLDAVAAGALVTGLGHPWTIPVGDALLGRCVDGLGAAVDGGPDPDGPRWPGRSEPIPLLQRHAVRRPWWTGIRIVDTLTTLGVGQRIGIYAGAGVGKTTLLHQLLAQAPYDRAVVALIGERGREAAAFWRGLPPATRRRLTVWVALADQPPLLRLRALEHATRCAEAWRAQGRHVLLCVDSLTRAAHAAREVGLAAGEPPTARGFPPSLWARLPQWLERAGPVGPGAMTAVYTVLLDGDEWREDPVADAVHGILDGALVLDRRLAERHQFPAVDPLRSLSRLQPDVVAAARWALAGRVREALGRAADAEDALAVGAVEPGRDPRLDRALAFAAAFADWARQEPTEVADPEAAWASLATLAAPLFAEDGGPPPPSQQGGW